VKKFRIFLPLTILVLVCTSFFVSSIALAQQKPVTIAVSKQYAPFSFVGQDGKPRGLLIDIWKLWSETTRTPVQFVPSTWKESLEGVKTGKVDVHVGLFENEQRKEWMGFSTPVHEIKTAVYFLTQSAKKFQEAGLQKGTAGTIAGTFQESFLKEQYPALEVKGFKTYSDTVNALMKGETDYAVGETPTFEARIEQLGLRRDIERSSDELLSNTVHAGVLKENTDLLEKINKGFSSLPFDKLVELDEFWLRNPADRFYRKIVETVELTREEEDWLAVHPFLRFAVTDFLPPVDIVDDKGNYTGLNADLIVLLNKKLGTRIVPEFFSKWSDVVENGLNGKVDGVFSFSRTPQREKLVFFTKPYAIDPIVLIARQDNREIRGRSDLKGKRVSVVKGTAATEEARALVADGELIEVDTEAQALRMLALDEIDAHIGQLIPYGNALKESGVTGLKIADAKNTEGGSFRIAIPKDRPILFSIIQKGMNALTRAELSALQFKWLRARQDQEISQDKLNLSQEERHWLDLSEEINVGMMDDWPPFSFVDDNGINSGISPAFVEAVNKRLGGRLKLIPGPWKGHLKGLKEGKIDALLDLTPTEPRREIYNITKPYLNIPHVIIGPKEGELLESENDLKGKVLALEKGFGNVKFFQDNHPQVTIREYPNTRTALGAVSRGEADAYAGNRAVATYIMEKEVILNLKPHGRLNKSGSVLAFGIRKDLPVLARILQKTLDDIGQEERRAILQRWVRTPDGALEKKPLALSESEAAWLKTNKSVRVMVGNWPPFHFMTRDKPNGMALDFVKTALDRIGLGIEYVPISWTEALKGISNLEKVDLLPTIAHSVEREKLVTFTQPYLSFPRVIFARNDDNSISSLKSLYGRTVAVEESFITRKLLEKDHPKINLLVVASTKDALEAVSFGRADAFVSNLAVGRYLIGEQGLLNLKVAAQTSYKNDIQHMGVRKDWPELASILDKALDALTEKERREIRERWVSSETDIPEGQSEVESKDVILQIGIGAIVMVVLLLAMVFAMRVLEGKDTSRLYQSRELKGLGLALIGVFLCVVVLSAWYTVKSVEDRTRQDIGYSLQTILHTTHEALKLWVGSKEADLLTISEAFGPRTLVRNLLQVPRTPEDLLKSSQLFQIRNMLEAEKKRIGDIGFFVIAPDGISIASMRDENIGTPNLIYQKNRGYFDRVFKGEAVLIPPMVSDVDLGKGEQSVTMFLAAPVMDLSDKKVIAALAMQLNSKGEFTDIIQLGRMGLSGETYAFDREGWLMSSSRFENNLLETGLLGEGQESILHIRIADPGGDLLRGHPLPKDLKVLPLTLMAGQAIQGKSKINVVGYRDYRGVSVMGAWLWDEKLGLGMTTEVDVHEALDSYFTIRNTVLVVLGITVLMALALTGLTTWVGRSANRSLRKARDDLERKVEARTAEVAEKEAQLRLAMDTMTDGIFMLNKDMQYVLFNNRYRDLVELPGDIIQIGASVTEVIRAHAQRGDYGPGAVDGRVRKQRLGLLNDQVVDTVMPINNGKRVLSLRKAPIEGGGAVVVLTDITVRQKAEEELSKQRKILRNVLDNVVQGIVKWGADQTLISWNTHFQSTLDLPDEFMVEGRPLKDITGLMAVRGDYGEGDPEKLSSDRIEFLMSGEASRIEFAINNETYDVHIQPTDDGGIIVTYTDITERKRQEDALRKSEQQVRHILEDSPVAVAISLDDKSDQDGVVQFANSRFLDMMGISDTDIGTIRTDSFVPGGEKRDVHQDVLDGGESLQNIEQKVITRDGELLWTLMSISPIEFKERKAALIWFYDITQRKQAENKLTDAYEVISDSINYAAKIQRSVLPDGNIFSSLFSDHFVLWEPRDVVGGDIYWSRMWGDGLLVILGDCTGHGVPGAFMTLIATGALDNALSDIAGGQVEKLMQRLHQLIQETLGQHGEGAEADDGMELGMCFLGANLDEITFVGARFELYIVEDGNVSIIKGTKSGIGYHGIPFNQEYEKHQIVNLDGKSLYMTSDGLVDQVGGERGRMFGKKRFRELLLKMNSQPMEDQKELIHKALVDYQGEQRRRDDIAVIGFRV
jgi:PAS domain S-box-containing protein